jgi:hypothetical protein
VVEHDVDGEPQSHSDLAARKLREVIVRSIEPDPWHSHENRFGSGVIHHWAGRPIVQHRPSVQKRIGELLERMREGKDDEPRK